MQAEWKPVEVLAQGDSFFLVSPRTVENRQDLTQLKKTLRVGDEIILTAENLYDGKVIK